MKRPAAVTILAVLHWLEAVLFALLAGMLLWFARLAADLQQYGVELPGVPPQMAEMVFRLAEPGIVAAILVVLGFFAVLFVVIGAGLWKLQNWARLITLVLMALRVVMVVAGTLLSLLLVGFDLLSLGLDLLFIVVYAWIVWYLLQPQVKRAFGAAP
ncbi:hypothetical protein MYX77_03430 [Acidobacteriia bacterium AH_259_A11_L15]|nr:hypothetical protein [Acidobacteriia bacterium AH_259_A11_L15]